MIHLGDIKNIDGFKIPVVDVITGGSPCQDLSVAGKRAGLDGERSGLFMEQIRVTKEMRDHDRATGRPIEYVRPRFLVWENVAGSLSSPGTKSGEDHTGEDFQAVLTEIVKIVQPDAPDVPLSENRKWSKSGCLMGIGRFGCPFSIAWRLHDAQFWGATMFIDDRVLFPGTPQRRKRIALVADFGGLSAPEILFERRGLSAIYEPIQSQCEGLSGNLEQSCETWKGTAGDSEESFGESDQE